MRNLSSVATLAQLATMTVPSLMQSEVERLATRASLDTSHPTDGTLNQDMTFTAEPEHPVRRTHPCAFVLRLLRGQGIGNGKIVNRRQTEALSSESGTERLLLSHSRRRIQRSSVGIAAESRPDCSRGRCSQTVGNRVTRIVQLYAA